MIANVSATSGGNKEIGDDAKSIKFMIFKNQINFIYVVRDLLQR
ncbi:hypothetical protein JCM19233_2685 [Vibrio astriarenae]|nr:hypothetical protein JCM19233_2685 [Vibrio sp. C7]